MVFTAEYIFALQGTALTIVMLAWVLARAAAGQNVFHAWLGCMAAGLLGTLCGALVVIPGSGPLIETIADAAGFMTGLLFAAGVRFEATRKPVGAATISVLLGISLALATVIQIVAPSDEGMRKELMQPLIGLAIGSGALWVPRLVREGASKLGAACLGLLAVGVAADRAVPLLRGLTPVGSSFVVPYENSDVVVILAGGAAMIIFSLSSARREPKATALSSQGKS